MICNTIYIYIICDIYIYTIYSIVYVMYIYCTTMYYALIWYDMLWHNTRRYMRCNILYNPSHISWFDGQKTTGFSGPGSVAAATYLLGQGTFASDRSPSLAPGANEAFGTGKGWRWVTACCGSLASGDGNYKNQMFKLDSL